jgi:hypothetical protein
MEASKSEMPRMTSCCCDDALRIGRIVAEREPHVR